jgi:hypothetical protein
MPEEETEGRPGLTQMPDDRWCRVRERDVERIRANGTTERLVAATVPVTMRERGVAAHPVTAEYAASAGRLVPVFVLGPAA